MAVAKGSGRSGGGCRPKLTETVPVGRVGGAGCRAAAMRQMTHTTLTVHATATTRRIDCANASDSNKLLLLSTTEPLLPAGPVPVHSRDGVHCRVTEYSGECRRIRVVTAMCRKCHERCRRHAAGWQRVAARRRRRGRRRRISFANLGRPLRPTGRVEGRGKASVAIEPERIMRRSSCRALQHLRLQWGNCDVLAMQRHHHVRRRRVIR